LRPLTWNLLSTKVQYYRTLLVLVWQTDKVNPFLNNYRPIAFFSWNSPSHFLIYLVYTRLKLPQRNDVTLVGMFWQAGYLQQQLQALNRCQLAHHLIFLSDMTLACGQNLNLLLLAPHPPGSAQRCSSYVCPKLHPSRTDWKLWLDFWMSTTGNEGILHILLGEWIHKTHRTWQ
jgi:hypothetical protein